MVDALDRNEHDGDGQPDHLQGKDLSPAREAAGHGAAGSPAPTAGPQIPERKWRTVYTTSEPLIRTVPSATAAAGTSTRVSKSAARVSRVIINEAPVFQMGFVSHYRQSVLSDTSCHLLTAIVATMLMLVIEWLK